MSKLKIIVMRYAVLGATALLGMMIACQSEQSRPEPESEAGGTIIEHDSGRGRSAAVDTMPVTLPVLDAFLADSTFLTEAGMQLALTEEEVAKLRTIAQEETMRLNEGEEDEYTGSPADARELAGRKIAQVIGYDRGAALARLIRRHWSGLTEEERNQMLAQQGYDSTRTLSAGRNTYNAIPSDSRIVVNAPAYRMDLFEGGKLVKSYKIAIGYPEFPLPTGLRYARSIIFNPTWIPPDEPWVESSTKVRPGQKVEAGSKLNPLGLIKIPIGLHSLIHGGKTTAKLGKFGSHGCVGLTNDQVQEIAVEIARLGETDLTDSTVEARAKRKTETKSVTLAKPVPVELRYETIVVQDGKLHLYRDVYDYNTNTMEALESVLRQYGVPMSDISQRELAMIEEAIGRMSRDALGRTDSTGADSAAGARETGRKGAKKPKEKVTRTVKGDLEAIIEIAALAGKGYPAPIGIEETSPESKPETKKKDSTTAGVVRGSGPTSPSVSSR